MWIKTDDGYANLNRAYGVLAPNKHYPWRIIYGSDYMMTISDEEIVKKLLSYLEENNL